MNNPLIYGKNELDRIVSIEPGNGKAEVFREFDDGSVTSQTIPFNHYILYSEQHSPKMKPLAGNQFYKWIMEYDDVARFDDVLKSSYKQRLPLHVIRDSKEALMIKDGVTYFKGMKVEDVSVLSFDIETTGLTHDKDSAVLLISNTFRRKGKVERKLFSLDDYPSQSYMISAWTQWVRLSNPSVITGHNLYGFDLPYLAHVASLSGLFLILGRDLSPIRFAARTSVFRKDGSQGYDYTNATIYGREIVDTWFLSMKYDTAARREYESYKLKEIIKHEKLEKADRVHYDASLIRQNWSDLREREKIKAYAIHDADDALALYDLMIPSLFYLCQSVPRSFQALVNTATGSHVNSLMLRAYLQQGHSIALGSEKEAFEGAISFGVPGIHKNVFKIDVQSLYPSIILSQRICNRRKDPQELFVKLVEFFTAERIKNKEMFEKTGERYYSDLSDSQKIAINSMYGFLGAPKLNYNSPEDAARVTETGREILKQAILWASGNEFVRSLQDIKEVDTDA
jgi:DNA polymerase elongation subunit (family B)